MVFKILLSTLDKNSFCRRFILPHNLKAEELTCSLAEDGKLLIKGQKVPARKLSISGSSTESISSGAKESDKSGKSGKSSGSDKSGKSSGPSGGTYKEKAGATQAG
jgi:Hsp20/alpha crystallin family